jgi:hypothetical protein
MEKTFTVEKCLFDDIYDVATYELAELAQRGEIPTWGSYSIDKIERVPPIKDYYISLHAGPIESPGPVVAAAYIHVVSDEDTAEVTVVWDEAPMTAREFLS